MAELDTFREGGLWSVRVLAGAATAEELRLIAPVLAGSVDLSRHPYRLRSGLEPHRLATALTVKVQDASDGAATPFPATAGVLAALAGLPRREVPGLRVLDPGYFDVTSETEGRDRPGAAASPVIEVGAILDPQGLPVPSGCRCPPLTRHAFVTGATGAGKSQTVRHILEQCSRAGLPWLAIEPAKSEYAAMAGRLEGTTDVTVINPTDPRAVPLSVNPLAPEPGYPVQAHIDMVRALFHAAFGADEPFPQIMSQALQRVYEEAGWDVVTGRGLPGAPVEPAIPTLAQLERAALDVIDDVGYGPELQADVRGFVNVRLRLAARRLGGPVLRGRSPGRHRRAAAAQRSAGHRGRGQRRGQDEPRWEWAHFGAAAAGWVCGPAAAMHRTIRPLVAGGPAGWLDPALPSPPGCYRAGWHPLAVAGVRPRTGHQP